jgi:LysR family glycine cleavage system transcriptional activator
MSMAEGGHLIDLAALPTFCSRWLIPRLPSFFAQHPDITLNCASRFFPFDFATEPFDAAIHFGAPAWPGGVLHHLFSERMIPVCAPNFAATHGLRRDSDLADAPLLQQTTRPTAWRDWFESAGVAGNNASRGARFDQISMLAEAALAGLGVALAPEFLIEQEVASGRLIRIGAHVLETDKAYYLVVPEEKAGGRALTRFRTWITAQAARSLRAFRRAR